MFVGAANFIVAVLIPAFVIIGSKSNPTVKSGTVPFFSSARLAAGFAGAIGISMRHLRDYEGGRGSRNLCGASDVGRYPDHQYTCDDLLLSPPRK